MEKIYCIGDAHTVNLFRIAGVDGEVAERDGARDVLRHLIRRGDVGVIVITQDCGEGLDAFIGEVNLKGSGPVIVLIPGLDEARGFEKSLLTYITEALGMAV